MYFQCVFYFLLEFLESIKTLPLQLNKYLNITISDAIKHECGIALLRLKKPLEFYLEKYGSAFYGIEKVLSTIWR